MQLEAPHPEPAPNGAPNQTLDGKTVPPCIAFFLGIVRTLIGYGTRLRDTLPNHADHPDFPKLATPWATLDIRRIVSHIHRGILRAMALERYLLARAAQGRDVKPTPILYSAEEEDVAALAFKLRAPPKQSPPPRTYPARRPLADFDDPLHFSIPTTEELASWVRGHSLSRLLADICLDMGVTPTNTVWDTFKRIQDALRHFGHGEGDNRYYEIQGRRNRRVAEGIHHGTGGWNYRVREGDTPTILRDRLGFLCGDPLPGAIAPPSG